MIELEVIKSRIIVGHTGDTATATKKRCPILFLHIRLIIPVGKGDLHGSVYTVLKINP